MKLQRKIERPPLQTFAMGGVAEAQATVRRTHDLTKGRTRFDDMLADAVTRRTLVASWK